MTVQRWSILALCVIIFLFGCSLKRTLPGPPIDAIKKIAAKYNEPNPKIVRINPSTAEVTNQPMYIVFLTGNFSNGKLKASTLEFSIFANGTMAWAIQATDDKGKDVWLDNE